MPAEEKFSLEELTRIYTDHKQKLEDELLNTEKVLNLLSDLPWGVTVDIPRPTFFVGSNGKVVNAHPSPDDRVRGNWAKDIMAVIREAPETAPLLTTAQIISKVSERIKFSLDLKQRGNVSVAVSGLRRRGDVGFIRNDLTGDYVHGDLKYFRDGGTSLKPKYLPLLTKVLPSDDDEEEQEEQQPEPPKAKIPAPRELTKEELETWNWRKEILKFFEEYNPETDGLLTATQIYERISAKYKNLDKDPKREAGLVGSHLKLMWDKNVVGRCKNMAGKTLIWGNIKYFDDNVTIKKKYEHFTAV